ncbi:hypothetical protein [Hydrogenophaga sp.]|uniref:hypothetical protein n=1 Tax=Hydrogenophaga sp. TaxID=1904254 RepID=UPI0027237A0D|nr:hypothetical protein [Hydrogenophaga sp.]MDO9435899.1 hypothetical protein [Hydrogenophaga sp.]
MGREAIRQLKRSVRASIGREAANDERILGRESALALLERSINFGHGRLAVLRLAIAVDVGASVARECWVYCREAAQKSNDRSLQELFRSAALKSMAAGCEATPEQG